jgi:ribosomal protein L20
MNYSTFIGALNKKGVLLNRKMLSQLAEKSPETFSRLVKQVS